MEELWKTASCPLRRYPAPAKPFAENRRTCRVPRRRRGHRT